MFRVPRQGSGRNSQRGLVLIEYLLLGFMMVAVSVAIFLGGSLSHSTSTTYSSDPNADGTNGKTFEATIEKKYSDVQTKILQSW